MAKLLSEFPAVATEAWEEAIAEDLKGADYGQKLIWRSPEGMDVKPYYRAEDVVGLKFLYAAPGEFPYLRGSRQSGGWRICEHVDAVDPEEANNAARGAVADGAEEIAFQYASIENPSDVRILLANLGKTPVRFEHVSASTVRVALEFLKRRSSGAILSGDLDWSTDPDFAAEVIQSAPPEFMPLTIRADSFGEAGATAVEEAGFALASGVDFLAKMQGSGAPVDRAAAAIAFSFLMGPEYFMQIAKLRAFRMVWAHAVESFGGSRERARACIYARTSRWNRTVYDPQVNMLRATTEAMSAVLGGADSIYVAPFDDCCRTGDEVSRRLARNTQIVLKQESHLARVADPGGGSYFLEALTHHIAREAWKLLQEIEAAGGFRKSGDRIAQTLELRKADQRKSVAARRRVLIGTNRFATAGERGFDRVGGRLIHDSSRAAVPFEELRLRTERHANETGKMPRILLAEIGDAKMRAARSNFIAEFFACAGLATTIQRFETVRQIAGTDADMVVLCSSDPEYPTIATALIAELKARGANLPIVIAGNPEGAQGLRAAGVIEFVHLRSNPIQVLTTLQQLMGMGT